LLRFYREIEDFKQDHYQDGLKLTKWGNTQIIQRLKLGSLRLRWTKLARSGLKVVDVVFDILRATSTMTVALNSGANSIYPVKSVEEAVVLHRENPDWLLAGEQSESEFSSN